MKYPVPKPHGGAFLGMFGNSKEALVSREEQIRGELQERKLEKNILSKNTTPSTCESHQNSKDKLL